MHSHVIISIVISRTNWIGVFGAWASCQIRKIAGAHAPGMPGTFSPPSGTSDPDMHHGTCVTHVPWCMPGSLTSVFLWSQWRGKTFPAFPAHAQPAISRIWQEAHGGLVLRNVGGFIFLHIENRLPNSLRHVMVNGAIRMLYLFRRNVNIYLQFISSLHNDMTLVVKIIPHVRQELAYSRVNFMGADVLTR